jgi:hypothetical protein
MQVMVLLMVSITFLRVAKKSGNVHSKRHQGKHAHDGPFERRGPVERILGVAIGVEIDDGGLSDVGAIPEQRRGSIGGVNLLALVCDAAQQRLSVVCSDRHSLFFSDPGDRSRFLRKKKLRGC